MYNAVVTSKFAYGLETLQFTDKSLNKMNTFQLKGLRKILGVQPTFIDRTQTNARVLALANKEAGAKEDKPPKIKLISEIIKNRRVTLLGHVIRSDRKDPMKQVTFEDEHLRTKSLGIRRAGRPRQKWIENTMREAWETVRSDTSPYIATIEQRQEIAKQAANHEGPFKTKKNISIGNMISKRLRRRDSSTLTRGKLSVKKQQANL